MNHNYIYKINITKPQSFIIIILTIPLKYKYKVPNHHKIAMPTYTSWAGFLISFYVFHEYASKSKDYPFNGNYKYPSYVIAKEKLFRPLAALEFKSIELGSVTRDYFS